ncbi:MAG TPA: hypothetical protein VJ717_15535 [Gemmatimonadaceae bacterium]|nr:hypothetical protein [Gemmatimonadaceae bacterium]
MRHPVRPNETRSTGPRRGSALITALMLLAVMSAAAAASLTMITTERQAVSDSEAQSGAYAIARSAFDQFIANPQAAIPSLTSGAWTGPDSARFNFADGFAYVRVQRLVPAASGRPALFSVRAHGVRTSYRPGNTPAAERIFAQFARFHTGGMSPLSAWTSLTGILKTGGAGTVDGADACGQASAVAGVAVPTVPGYVQGGGAPVPTGTPKILDMGTQAQANAMIPIDWIGIVSGTALTPDVAIPGGAWPSFADPAYWPIVYVDQAAEFTLPSDGRGLLIVRNNLRLTGVRSWDGIILVGGVLTSNGTNTVSGAVVTGLNVLLGHIVPPSDLGNGTKTFRYDSCKVANAAARFSGLAPLRNTTVDNWPVY